MEEMNYLYCLYFCKKEALRKFREIEISLYSTGIMAVFTPANRDKEGYLWQFLRIVYTSKEFNKSKAFSEFVQSNMTGWQVDR